MPIMTIITASKDGETTRFAIGCADAAKQAQQALERSGYRCSAHEDTLPNRSAEEARRASRILAALFGN